MNLKKTSPPVQEYSEAFKRQVVSEYERGLYMGHCPLRRMERIRKQQASGYYNPVDWTQMF